VADNNLDAPRPISGSGWPTHCLVDRSCLRPTTRQPADLPQQGGEEMGLAPGLCVEKPEKNSLARVPAMKMGLAPIRTIGACPIFTIPPLWTEDFNPQTVFAIFQNLETDSSAYASDSALQTTGDQWLNAVDDLFLKEDSDLFGW